ncbi:MAG: outer membrane beta-barrel protein [Ferruginibacter sp.]
MKKFFFIAALAVASFSVKAQDSKPLSFSVGAEAHLPLGNLADIYSVGFGGSVQADYALDQQLAVTLNAGYLNFSGKDGWGNTGMIPVLGGIKYTFQGNVYASAQLGASFGTEKNSGTSFTYAPGIGYKFSPNFDALLKYTGWSNDGSSTSAIGLRVAYTF